MEELLATLQGNEHIEQVCFNADGEWQFSAKEGFDIVKKREDVIAEITEKLKTPSKEDKKK